MKTLKERTQFAVDQGFTVKQLAEAAGVTSSAVSQWLSGGTKSIKSPVAVGLSSVTGWTVSWWVSGKEPRLIQTADGTVFSSSATTSQLAPVLAWASLGVDLFKEANEVEAIGFAPVPRGASALVKWFVVEQDHRRFGITKGDMVALDPLTGTDKPEEMKRHVFETASGQFILAEYRTLAGDSFEALPDSGTALEKERHGLAVVARVRGVWEA